MNDLMRKKIADAAARLARVEQEKNLRRAEFEIALAALIARECEYAEVIARLNALRREANA